MVWTHFFRVCLTLNFSMRSIVQGVLFNWASLEFAKCWSVSNRFRKNVRVPDCPPPHDRKKSKCLEDLNVILILTRFRGGAVEAFFGGGQSRDVFRGGPVKKTPCIIWAIRKAFQCILQGVRFLRMSNICILYGYNRTSLHHSAR